MAPPLQGKQHLIPYYTTVTSWTSGSISGAEYFQSFITQILPARNNRFTFHGSIFSCDGFRSSYTLHKSVIFMKLIKQLPTLRNSNFCSYSQDTVTKNSCVLHLNCVLHAMMYMCTRTAADNTVSVRKRSKTGIC